MISQRPRTAAYLPVLPHGETGGVAVPHALGLGVRRGGGVAKVYLVVPLSPLRWGRVGEMGGEDRTDRSYPPYFKLGGIYLSSEWNVRHARAANVLELSLFCSYRTNGKTIFFRFVLGRKCEWNGLHDCMLVLRLARLTHAISQRRCPNLQESETYVHSSLHGNNGKENAHVKRTSRVDRSLSIGSI